jgi:hypothetical protein
VEVPVKQPFAAVLFIFGLACSTWAQEGSDRNASGEYRIDNSLALEFGGRLWFDLLPRTYLMGGISFLRTRPALTLADGSREVWKADRFRLEMGVAFLVLRRP